MKIILTAGAFVVGVVLIYFAGSVVRSIWLAYKLIKEEP